MSKPGTFAVIIELHFLSESGIVQAEVISVTYSEEEYNFLCVMFAALRDAMQLHDGFKELADRMDILGTAVFREEELSVGMLNAIKKVLIFSLYLIDPDATDEVNTKMRDLRQKALLRTVAMLKEKRQED